MLYFKIKDIINILQTLFLGLYCKLRILVFPLRPMARALRAWAINRWGKTPAVIYSTLELG